MPFFTWLRSVCFDFGRSKAHRRRQRPILEVLEDRTVPTGGALDTTFGDGGRVNIDFTFFNVIPRAVAVDSENRIVVASEQRPAAGGEGDILVMRFNSQGQVDSSFGAGGTFIHDFGGDDHLGGMVVQANGKIVLAGSTKTGSNDNFAVARYTADGDPDTFGTDGQVVTDFGAGDDFGLAVALENGGTGDPKIIVAGRAAGNFALARYTAAGALDNTFDSDGKVVVTLGGNGSSATGVVVQPDDTIVAAGSAGGLIAMVRLNPDGSFNNVFSGDGKLITTIPGVISSLIQQPDFKLIVGGAQFTGATSTFELARINVDGSLDSGGAGDGTPGDSFGVGGVVSTDIAVANPALMGGVTGLALGTGGKIIAVGAVASGTTGDFAVARYLPNGTLDPDFGVQGKTTTDFGGIDGATALALQGDDIVAAGVSIPTANAHLALTRYTEAAPNRAPNAVLQVLPPNLEPGQDLTLNGSNSFDPDGDQLTYSWDLNDDGNFGDATGAVVQRTYAQLQALGLTNGLLFPVKMRVSDNRGASAETGGFVFLNAPHPTSTSHPTSSTPAQVEHTLQKLTVKRTKEKGATVLELINNATGSSVKVRVATGAQANSLVFEVADVNGDFVQDLVFGLKKKGGLSLVDGSTGLTRTIPGAVFRKFVKDSFKLNLDDFNNDGVADILLRGAAFFKKKYTVVLDGKSLELVRALLG